MQLVLPWKKSKINPDKGTPGNDKPIIRRPRKKLKKKTIVLLIILAILLIAGGVGIYFLFFKQDAATIVTGETTTGTLATTLQGTGTTVPASSATYSFASDADILEVDVAAGDTVEVGDLLYVQDDTEIDDEIASYQESIADLNVKLDEYNSSLSDLQETIDNLTITALFSGRLLSVNVEDGDTVKSGDTLAVLVDDSVMKVTQYFSYAYENDVYLGMTGRLSIASQMLTLDATVTDIEKVERVTSEGTRCFAVTVEVTNPGSLTEGMTGAGYLLADSGEKIYPAVEGSLKYAQSKTITAKASGDLNYINAVAYQKVTKGDKLFVIDGSSYETQLNNAERNISSTEQNIQSYEDRITQAEEDRAKYTVRSEISGKVIFVNARVSRTPTQGQTAIAIYNLDTMEVSIDIDELDIDNITMDMAVTIVQTGSESDTTYKGTVSEISYEATNTNGVAYFPITVSINSEGNLSAGVNVSYYITVGDEEEGVLAPIGALKTTDEGPASL
jgi:multidrug efflux pump subunit AcrA (membrane-fusion protein)